MLLNLILFVSTAQAFRVAERLFETNFEALSCKAQTCVSSSTPWKEGVCIYPQSSSENLLKPCSGMNSYCDPNPNPSSNVTCTTPPTVAGQSYPGEACKQDEECLYGYCEGGVCNGQSLNEDCNQPAQCNPGLTCASGQCIGLLATGSTGCQVDTDCENNAGCNYLNGVGTCVEYFSIPAGNVTGNCDAKYSVSLLCSSGYCEDQSYFNSLGTCLEAPVSEHLPPHPCTKDSDCGGLTNTITVSGKCQCGYNPEGKSYCAIFEGDPAGVRFMDVARAVAKQSGRRMCNVARRFSETCWKMVEDVEKLEVLKTYYEFRHYAQLQGIEDCAEEIYFPEVSLAKSLALAGLVYLLS